MLFALIGNAFYKKDVIPSQSSADELPLTRDDLEWPPLALWPSSAERIFIISRLSRSAERSKRIFTRGVVEENGICSAACCASAALRESTANLRPLRLCFANPPLPKGEARAPPEAFSLHLKLQQRALDLGSPFGRAGAGAPERVSRPLGEGGLTRSGKTEGVRSPAAGSPSPSLLTQCHLSQRERLWRNRTLCISTGNYTAMPRALPLGELSPKVTERASPLRGGDTPSVCSRWSQPPVPHSVADATSLLDRGESVQGDGFSGGGKLPGMVQRRPLGGAGTAKPCLRG